MDGFRDLPRQFGRVWSSKKINGFDILLVVLGGSTLIKKNYEMDGEEVRACRRQLEISKTGSDKMAKV